MQLNAQREEMKLELVGVVFDDAFDECFGAIEHIATLSEREVGLRDALEIFGFFKLVFVLYESGVGLEWEVAAPQKIGIFAIWMDSRGKGLPESTNIRPDRIIKALPELL